MRFSLALRLQTLIVCSIICATPRMAAAQAQKPPGRVFGGFAIVSTSDSDPQSRASRPGWMAGLTLPVARSLSLVVEFDRVGWSNSYSFSAGQSRFNYSISTFGGGARFERGVGFVQVLVGRRRAGESLTHSVDGSTYEFTPHNSIMAQPGVGLAAPIGRRGLFLLQADWRTGPWGSVHVSSDHSPQKAMRSDVRLVGGFGFAFSHR